MERADVIVIGGGPAGSSCAWQLTHQGLDVVVLDREEFPRDKVCAGWVTPAVLESLGISPAEYAESRTLQPIRGFRTCLMGSPGRETQYRETVSYGIRRCEFDHYLLQRSAARMQLGKKIESLEHSADGWVVNKRFHAPMLVGAGGHFCPVARRLGARPGSSERAVTAKEIEFRLAADQAARCRVRPEVPELYFCPDLKGYGWCVRKGDYLNIGLGREDPHRLGEHLEAFRKLLCDQEQIACEIPAGFKGHAYILYRHTKRRILDDSVLLIGDAAGLAYPASGEGIRPAVESGLMAAEVIGQAAGDYRLASLTAYETRLRERFGAGRVADSLIPRSLRNFVGKRLLSNPWASRHLILDRGFLHRQQPSLRVATLGQNPVSF